jgi:hypothetical protein
MPGCPNHRIRHDLPARLTRIRSSLRPSGWLPATAAAWTFRVATRSVSSRSIWSSWAVKSIPAASAGTVEGVPMVPAAPVALRLPPRRPAPHQPRRDAFTVSVHNGKILSRGVFLPEASPRMPDYGVGAMPCSGGRARRESSPSRVVETRRRALTRSADTGEGRTRADGEDEPRTEPDL